jgi:hypothetical protein
MTTKQDPFKAQLWWKLWFAFCAILGLGLLGLVVWAVIEIVDKVTR